MGIHHEFPLQTLRVTRILPQQSWMLPLFAVACVILRRPARRFLHGRLKQGTGAVEGVVRVRRVLSIRKLC